MFEKSMRTISRVMRMDEATWERHANPWSAYTRMATLPAIILAIWSRRWIGWHFLWSIALLLLLNWWNPRAFPKPANQGFVIDDENLERRSDGGHVRGGRDREKPDIRRSYDREQRA